MGLRFVMPLSSLRLIKNLPSSSIINLKVASSSIIDILSLFSFKISKAFSSFLLERSATEISESNSACISDWFAFCSFGGILVYAGELIVNVTSLIDGLSVTDIEYVLDDISFQGLQKFIEDTYARYR